MLINTNSVLEWVMVLGFVLCSGSQHFRLYHAVPTLLFWLGISLIVLASKKFLLRKVFKTAIIVGFFLFINVITHIYLAIDFGAVSAFLITIFAIVVMLSCMPRERFKYIFVNIIFIIALISLFCYVYIVILKGASLPFQYEQIEFHENGYNIVYLTPYYTMGWLASGGYFNRNAGMFVEPGVYQVFLNLSLLFIWTGCLSGMSLRRKNAITCVIIITLLTTRSTTGYLCFLLVGLCGMIYNNIAIRKKDIMVGILLIGMCLFVYQKQVYAVFGKIIYRTGTWDTRWADTVGTLKMCFINPILGQGMFNSLGVRRIDYGVLTGSNGLLNIACTVGIPMFACYLVRLYFGIKNAFSGTNAFSVCVWVILICMLIGEPIGTYPIFMYFIFASKEERGELNNDSSGNRNDLPKRGYEEYKDWELSHAGESI